MIEVVRVLAYAGEVVDNMKVDLLIVDVWDRAASESLPDVTNMVFALNLPLSCFVEMLSGVVVEPLAADIGVGVLTDANINVSAAVMNALEFVVSIP